MSRIARAEPPPVKAPTDRGSAILVGLGITCAASSLLAPALAPVGLVGGALVVALGLRQRIFGRAVVRTHAALQAITRGQIEEAETHLDAIPRFIGRSGTIMRSVVYQRALIAFYRSDAANAVATIEPATSKRVKLATQNYEHMQRSIALSLRALAFASTGDAERARSDAAEVEASVHATPEALARVRLAEAVVLARSGATAALASHFRTHGSLILEHAFPRERVLARALRKMVQTRAHSVYREAARPEPEEEKPTGAIGEWIASIAPDAAAHATEASRLADRSELVAPPAVTEAALRAVKTARDDAANAKKRGTGRTHLVRAGAAIGIALALYYLLASSSESTASSAPPPASLDPLFAAVFAAVTIGFAIGIARLVVATQKVRREERTVLAAQRALALGDLATADPLLAALERSPRGLSAAQAYFMRAKYAEQHARFGECLDLCNLALGSVMAQDKAHRMLASMALTPSIAGLRALALAAIGRSTEANAELATIAREHATWSHRASTEVRVRLLLAVKGGDLEAARAIARERTPELPITLRDETLADLVLATVSHGASRDEQERVDGEIREDAIVRTWIDAVAPDLREDLARRVGAKHVRVEVPSYEGDESDEESEEAEAAARLSSSS